MALQQQVDNSKKITNEYDAPGKPWPLDFQQGPTEMWATDQSWTCNVFAKYMTSNTDVNQQMNIWNTVCEFRNTCTYQFINANHESVDDGKRMGKSYM